MHADTSWRPARSRQSRPGRPSDHSSGTTRSALQLGRQRVKACYIQSIWANRPEQGRQLLGCASDAVTEVCALQMLSSQLLSQELLDSCLSEAVVEQLCVLAPQARSAAHEPASYRNGDMCHVFLGSYDWKRRLTKSAGGEPGEEQGGQIGIGSLGAPGHAIVAPPQQRQCNHKKAKQAGDGRHVRQVLKRGEQCNERCAHPHTSFTRT